MIKFLLLFCCLVDMQVSSSLTRPHDSNQRNMLYVAINDTRLREDDDSSLRKRYLRHIQPKYRRQKEHEYDPGVIGNSLLVPKKTVYGAVVTTDPDLIYQDKPADSNGTVTTLRSISVSLLTHELPFPVTFWPALFSQPCPFSLGDNKKERGLANAHLRIWQDFVYFDLEVMEESAKGVSEPFVRSSHSGTFVAYPNKTFTKNGVPFMDNDIILILEDDAEVVVVDGNVSLVEELALMNTDILWLGWCDGRKARPVPLCTHAYAMSRRGARKFVQNYEPCGLALDEQLVVICKNKWATYSVAHDWSWKNRYKPGYPKPGAKNFGIFHQNKIELGSMIGHATPGLNNNVDIKETE